MNTNSSTEVPPAPNSIPPVVPKTNLLTKFRSLSKKQKIIICIGLLVLITVVISLVLLLKRSSNTDKSENPNSKANNSRVTNEEVPVSEKVIAKVGEEVIFKRDLDYELTFQPGPKTDKLKKILVEKLVNDSITLQAAQKEKIITLGSTEFNVEAKDYQKRINEIKSVQAKIDNSQSKISGTMVSVWFYNMKPAKIGLEKGKQEALKRITELRRKVASKELTIEQAGDSIKKDATYENLDFGYFNNALIPFTSAEGKGITFDKKFDDILWNTNAGNVTEIFLGKTVNEFTNKEEESFYVFALVKEKTGKGNTTDFTKWLETQKKNYEVTYY